ncbi:MAG: SHOCT domain-containing protein [Chloroflexota bacterium]
MMWGTSDVGWGWMTLGWVWMVVVWGSIIWLVVWGISRVTPGRTSSSATPLDIAKERYARGEITKEQFEDLKRTLQ